MFGNIADGHVRKVFFSREASSIFENLRMFIPINVEPNYATGTLFVSRAHVVVRVGSDRIHLPISVDTYGRSTVTGSYTLCHIDYSGTSIASVGTGMLAFQSCYLR